jgi:hypothetical protein
MHGHDAGCREQAAERLIAKSLLVRTADPQDGRAQTLSLTRAGRSMVPKLAALADTNDAEFFDHLTAERSRGAAAHSAGNRREARAQIPARRVMTPVYQPHREERNLK